MSRYYSLILLYITLISCNKNCETYNSERLSFGIDVSHYQDDKSPINWNKVQKNNNLKIEFVYIRTTMGKNGTDNSYNRNIQELKKLDIPFGVYHYFRPNETAHEQFENFKKHNTDLGTLTPAVDVEENSKFGNKYFKKELLTFLKLIEQEYHIEPIIYAPQKFYNLYLWRDFKKYDFWIARQHGINSFPENNKTGKKPNLLGFKCPLIWQYSGTGTINGINSKVDLNITSKAIWDD